MHCVEPSVGATSCASSWRRAAQRWAGALQIPDGREKGGGAAARRRARRARRRAGGADHRPHGALLPKDGAQPGVFRSARRLANLVIDPYLPAPRLRQPPPRPPRRRGLDRRPPQRAPRLSLRLCASAARCAAAWCAAVARSPLAIRAAVSFFRFAASFSSASRAACRRAAASAAARAARRRRRLRRRPLLLRRRLAHLSLRRQLGLRHLRLPHILRLPLERRLLDRLAPRRLRRRVRRRRAPPPPRAPTPPPPPPRASWPPPPHVRASWPLRRPRRRRRRRRRRRCCRGASRSQTSPPPPRRRRRRRPIARASSGGAGGRATSSRASAAACSPSKASAAASARAPPRPPPPPPPRARLASASAASECSRRRACAAVHHPGRRAGASSSRFCSRRCSSFSAWRRSARSPLAASTFPANRVTCICRFCRASARSPSSAARSARCAACARSWPTASRSCAAVGASSAAIGSSSATPSKRAWKASLSRSTAASSSKRAISARSRPRSASATCSSSARHAAACADVALPRRRCARLHQRAGLAQRDREREEELLVGRARVRPRCSRSPGVVLPSAPEEVGTARAASAAEAAERVGGGTRASAQLAEEVGAGGVAAVAAEDGRRLHEQALHRKTGTTAAFTPVHAHLSLDKFGARAPHSSWARLRRRRSQSEATPRRLARAQRTAARAMADVAAAPRRPHSDRCATQRLLLLAQSGARPQPAAALRGCGTRCRRRGARSSSCAPSGRFPGIRRWSTPISPASGRLTSCNSSGWRSVCSTSTGTTTARTTPSCACGRTC